MNPANSKSNADFIRDNLHSLCDDELKEIAIRFWQSECEKRTDTRILRDLVYEYANSEKTLRLQNEQQQRMLAITAHDLHNPIISIRGLAELLLACPGDEPLENHRDLISAIRSAAEGMQLLVSNLLELSALDSQDFSLKFTKESLSSVLAERVLLFQTQAKNKNMILQSNIEDVETSWFDRARIAQVADNIIGNAIKFSPHGCTIEVSMKQEDSFLIFTVSDCGPGISAADKEKLFKSFQRLSAAPTGGEKSTGLGLSIVKRIVDLHGGHIHATNRPERGSTFWVHIPFKKEN